MTDNIRFVHLADLHLGAYREKRMTQLNFLTFRKAIDEILEIKPQFTLFSGDIFNNASPGYDLLKQVIDQFMRLKKAGIPIYVIGGSHDYSNNGKSFLDILHSAQIVTDVSNFRYLDHSKVELIFHKDTSRANITGILGKKNGLDKNIYANLNPSTLPKESFNIFMFHTTLDDIKPEYLSQVKSPVNSAYLPTGFDYYAGGHVHSYIEKDIANAKLSYPGPLFPNNFTELIREKPSFNLCEFSFENRKTTIKRIHINTYDILHIPININTLNPIQAAQKIENTLENHTITDKLVLLEISGIVDGKISDIRLHEIIRKLYDKSPYHIMKNTYKLTSSQIEDTHSYDTENTQDIENEIITSEINRNPDTKDKQQKITLMKELLKLELSKDEGEKVSQHEQRITDAIKQVLKI